MAKLTLGLCILLIISETKAISYNRPKFCPLTTWNTNGLTFVENKTIGPTPFGVFVNTNNTVYAASLYYGRIHVWLEGQSSPSRNVSGSLNGPFNLFVTDIGEIYVDNGFSNGRVDKWAANATTSTPAMYVGKACFGVFIDVNNTLYCSMQDRHQVVKRSLASSINTSIVAAGTGCIGPASNMISYPQAIFVDTDLNLFVADCGNNRIQLFEINELNGKTVAGNGVSGDILLNCPSGVVLDVNGYLFIVDGNNNRIIGSGPNGFRCLVGCSGGGSTSDKLILPGTLSFDSYGNMFVTDWGNARIQKFLINTNSCATSMTTQNMLTTYAGPTTTKIALTTSSLNSNASYSESVSYNRPTFDTFAIWNVNATTFANSGSIGLFPYGVFVNTNNTVYIISSAFKQIQIWPEGSNQSMKNISSGSSFPNSFFVSNSGEIYFDDASPHAEVDKRRLNSTNSTSIMYTSGRCSGLFIDIINRIHCSIAILNQVIVKSLSDLTNEIRTIAGTGCAGQTSYQLDVPSGIFVNDNLDLYVADTGNNRIQRFSSGVLNGTTVAGGTSPVGIALVYPRGVVLDGNNYLFIVDSGQNRIVRQDTNGFRCLVGCSGAIGSAQKLLLPWSIAFDSYGNIYVADKNNSRIQKFRLVSNNSATTVTTYITTENSSLATATTTGNTTGNSSLTITTITDTTTTSSSVTTTPVSILLPVNNTCQSPNITLFERPSTLLTPLQYRRSQSIYLMSYLQLNCNSSLSTIIKWTLKQCSSICLTDIQLHPSIVTTHSELFIPANILEYGIYEFKLTVIMSISSNMVSTIFAYVQIIPSNIAANLIQYGTSMIVHSYQQELILNPGAYSVDPDATTFNANNWSYDYYCRIYEHYTFPNMNGTLLTIDDSRIDPYNPSCLSNRTGNGSGLQYYGSITSPKSSLVILPGSFSSNQTYQMMTRMTHRQNSSLQAIGYLLIRVEEIPTPLIVLACVISSMCIPNVEYQYINPTTQVALFSICVNNCSKADHITWNIYQGSVNVSSNVIQWTLFNQMNVYRNIWFFGMNTNNFTTTNQLFIAHPSITYWRFEVVYWFGNRSSSSALNFIINQPPNNGSCSISPLNGTTSTLFTISCLNWFDEDNIKDYSLYGWITNPSDRIMLAFSSLSTNEVLLPGTNENGSLLHIVAYIHDTFDCVTEFNLSPVIVKSDFEGIESFGNSTNNSFVQILASGNQNRISQIITSLSQQLNKINDQAIEKALINGIPISTISISLLHNKIQQTSSSGALNAFAALAEYNKQVNVIANIRDFLIQHVTNLSITTVESIKLQSSLLAQLTEATNQLTRNSLSIASNKCHELALALQSKSTKISSNDVQTVATYLTQCVSQVLSSVNGPLQVRTSILDKDWLNANTFPVDYDTDLDSEWSNPNLFADENDFSWETIEKGRNIYYQKQLAKKIHLQITETISLISNAMKNHLNIGQNMTINCSSVFFQMETISSSSLSNKRIEQINDARIQIPANIHLTNNNHSIVSLRSIVQPLALSDKNGLVSNTNLSRSVSFTILDKDGNEIFVATDLNDRIELIIPRDPNLQIPSMTLQNVTTAIENTTHHQIFNLHFVKYAQSRWNNNRSVSLMFEMKPLNQSLAYLLIYRFDQSPHLNSSIFLLDGWALFCPSNLTSDNIFQYFLNNQQTFGHQSIIYGLRELNSTEYENTCANQSFNNLPITNRPFNFSSDYELRTYTSCCYYLDENNLWQTQGLLVGSETNHHQTQCLSTHLTTFAGGFLVLPSPINWNYVFANADFVRNKTIYLTVICVGLFYILIVIYARYKDKKDLEKLGVTPLSDNCNEDQYFYQILVFTGHRKNAGTDSKVHFIVAGNEDETHVRRFSDPHRKILQRGGIDAFILSVPKSLGSLNYIRIWHDNSGKGEKAAWFLKYIIIRDLQTMEKSYFICQQWFAVEKDDGRIERTLPIAGDLQKQEFSYLLSKQAYHSMAEGHLWFSIFSRPPSNKFTRVQRCTCCFVLLFTSMLFNILYYDQVNNAKANQTTGSLSFGPLLLTREQIGIGVIVEILCFIPSLLLIQLFRRTLSSQSKDRHSPLQETLSKLKQQPIQVIESIKKKRQRFMFPWWCIFIAYGLSFLLIVISSFFIIVRGIEFGDVKTQKWLTSLVSGFFSSILLIQPLKIVALAIFFAFFIRKSDKDKEAGEYLDNDHDDLGLSSNEQYLHSRNKASSFGLHSSLSVDRLNDGEIAWARDERLKEIRMWSVIREVLSYLSFLSLIYLITYSNINVHAFFKVNHLRKFFLNVNQPQTDYTKISTTEQYWNWLETSFVENLRAQEWYNGEPPRNLSGFINDKSNRLIGWATMRQLRIRRISCDRPLSSKCNEDYNFLNEEKQSFEPGWVNQTIVQNLNSSIHRAFLYQNGNQLDTYMYVGDHTTYSSGGYVYEYRGRLSDLRSNLSELHRLSWIDSQTRAIIIQLSLYNPNVELFTSVTFLMEFLSTGSLIPQYRFEPLSLQVFTSTFQLICTIIYIVFIIYNMIKEIQSFLRMKSSYFRRFWSYIDLGIIGCSWGVIGVYIWRYRESIRIGNRFKETNGYVQINLQFTTYINDVLTYLLGFCCYFGTLKFLRLCRFHQRLSLFIDTLQYARKDLFSFFAMFIFVFMAFLTLFYLLFVGKLWSCSTLLHTAQMLFEMMLMKFDAYELRDAAPILGPLSFCLFILIVVFVCMSMFITIISDSFRIVRKKTKVNRNEDHAIGVFMLRKFQRWIGLGRSNEMYLFDEQHELLGGKYYDSASIFPNKMDQLLNALDRIYVDQTKNMNIVMN